MTRQERQKFIEFLKSQDFRNSINGENDSCGQLFAGTIRYASMVFISHLILGGAYETNQADKEIITNSLKEINKVLDKYTHHDKER